jgi:transcription termination/antitermination protein NusG
MAAPVQTFGAAAGSSFQGDAAGGPPLPAAFQTRPDRSTLIGAAAVDIADRNDLPDDSTWHAVWTRSRHEPMVCAELAARGVDMFLPTVTRVSTWSDRKKRIASPLFPGYCFARFEPDVLSTVVRCTGVVTVLCNAGVPITIPGFEIEALQRMVASGLAYDPCANLVEGSRVRVINGPLSGVVGRLVRKGTQDLLILAVEILNSGARVQVSTRDIEPL